MSPCGEKPPGCHPVDGSPVFCAEIHKKQSNQKGGKSRPKSML